MTVCEGYIKLNDTELPLMPVKEKDIKVKKQFRGKNIRGKRNYYFIWRNKPYYLFDFMDIESHPGDCWVYPEFIDAVEICDSIRPMYIEFVGNFAVNIYIEGVCSYV